MKKNFKYFLLFFLLFLFVLMFKYNSLIKNSVLDSCSLWFTKLVPFLFPLYIMVDLLLNYGLSDILYKFFKNNLVVLTAISYLTGCPSNAKYIKEFYEDNLISKSTSEFLLLTSYSPNPLFILGISPSLNFALKVLFYIYVTNLLLAIIFKKRITIEESSSKSFKKMSFSRCVEISIHKSFNVLILILGIVTIFGIINSFISLIGINSILASSLLELTNAINIILKSNKTLYWIIFAVSFGGLSIHTQIKSILEGSDISYRYFLIGRIVASVPILLFLCFN